MKRFFVLLFSIGILVFAAYKVFSNDKAPKRLSEAQTREIYSAIVGEGKYIANGPRATFIENGFKWTIVGANAPIVNPTVYPKEWPVKGKDFEILVIPEPITNYKILPFTEKIENAVKSNTFSITAAKGEYEPASFVIRSGDVDLKDVMIEVTDLKTESMDENKKIGIISKENIDIRVVKCWYQAGTPIYDVNNKILVPELLLHDDDLVRVDYDKQVNIIRNFENIRDAENLREFSIPKRQNKQIWLTIRVPEKADPGIYSGKINIIASCNLQRSIILKLRSPSFCALSALLYLKYLLSWKA